MQAYGAREAVVHAYRHLYRGLLHAVQFSSPARHIARDQLRAAFRAEGAALDERGVKRTLWFLQAAARETGLEHRILKNLLRVRVHRLRQVRHWKTLLHHSKKAAVWKRDKELAMRHYEMTAAMLNKTMGLCLR